MSGYTSGPWRVLDIGGDLMVSPPDGAENIICDIRGRAVDAEGDSVLTPEDDANAQLIAAAPRLAEALKGMLNNPRPDTANAQYHPEVYLDAEAAKAAEDEARAALREAGIEP